MSNLNELKEYNESYYNKKIQFNCVLSEIKHISPNNEYVLSNNLNSFRFSPEIKNQHSINTHIISEITKGANKKNILDKLDSKPIQKSYIENVVKKIEFRELDSNAHKGKKKCIPFSNRTYIRTDGTVQFCERIGSFSQTHSDSELVDLSNSIIEDFNQMKSEDCSHCFAYNFCEMCPATFIVNGKFNSMVSNSKCSGYRELVKSALLIYINKEEANSE